MAPPRYYIPGEIAGLGGDGPMGASLVKPELIASVGLADVLERPGLSSIGCTGPDQQRGFICGMSVEGAPPVLYKPERQTWEPIGGDSPCWIGLENDHPTRPEELERGDPSGVPLELGDGQTWWVPVVRSPLAQSKTSLPMVMRMNGDGTVRYESKPEHAELLAIAESVWQATLEQAQNGAGATLVLKMDDGEQFRAAAMALGFNYRVTIVELSALGLLTTSNIRRVLLELVDFTVTVEVGKALADAKKNDEPARTGDGSSTDCGATD